MAQHTSIHCLRVILAINKENAETLHRRNWCQQKPKIITLETFKIKVFYISNRSANKWKTKIGKKPIQLFGSSQFPVCRWEGCIWLNGRNELDFRCWARRFLSPGEFCHILWIVNKSRCKGKKNCKSLLQKHFHDKRKKNVICNDGSIEHRFYNVSISYGSESFIADVRKKLASGCATCEFWQGTPLHAPSNPPLFRNQV